MTSPRGSAALWVLQVGHEDAVRVLQGYFRDMIRGGHTRVL